jgi:hypothetical protein
LLNGLAILGVRRWNPTREASSGPVEPAFSPSGVQRQVSSHLGTPEAHTTDRGLEAHATVRGLEAHATVERWDAPRTRPVWDYPVIWREMRTWAYGRKVVFVRVAYLLLAAAALLSLYSMARSDEGLTRYGATLATVPLFVLSLMLINAQGVTSLTNERDAKALDLLLVTDVTAKESWAVSSTTPRRWLPCRSWSAWLCGGWVASRARTWRISSRASW